MTYQKTTIIGFLGHDPSLKEFNGKQIVEFNVGVTEKKDETTWITVTAFDKTAEACKNYLNKGSQIYCEGKIKLETWQAKDGSNKSKLKLVADVVKFIGGKSQQSQKKEPSIRIDQLASSQTITGSGFSADSRFSDDDDDSNIPF